MNRTFHIAIMALAAVMLAGIAMADSVDIGLGEMSQSEFETLQQMVSGNYQPSDSVTEVKYKEIHVAEFNWSDVVEIRQAMVANGTPQDSMQASSADRLVDIGLGAMSTNEFCDLNKLVASNTATHTDGFGYICP